MFLLCTSWVYCELPKSHRFDANTGGELSNLEKASVCSRALGRSKSERVSSTRNAQNTKKSLDLYTAKETRARRAQFESTHEAGARCREGFQGRGNDTQPASMPPVQAQRKVFHTQANPLGRSGFEGLWRVEPGADVLDESFSLAFKMEHREQGERGGSGELGEPGEQGLQAFQQASWRGIPTAHSFEGKGSYTGSTAGASEGACATATYESHACEAHEAHEAHGAHGHGFGNHRAHRGPHEGRQNATVDALGKETGKGPRFPRSPFDSLGETHIGGELATEGWSSWHSERGKERAKERGKERGKGKGKKGKKGIESFPQRTLPCFPWSCFG